MHCAAVNALRGAMAYKVTLYCEATIIYTELEIYIIGKMCCVTRLQRTVQIADLQFKVVNTVL